jgi:ketosteroid isomerase-like protein
VEVDRMTDEHIKNSIRGFFKAWTTGDIKQALSFFDEDALFVVLRGTFRGTAQIEKYLMWVYRGTEDYKATETGIGIITLGNTAVLEHKLSWSFWWNEMGNTRYSRIRIQEGKTPDIRGS